jgi:hypothetical protein
MLIIVMFRLSRQHDLATSTLATLMPPGSRGLLDRSTIVHTSLTDWLMGFFESSEALRQIVDDVLQFSESRQSSNIARFSELRGLHDAGYYESSPRISLPVLSHQSDITRPRRLSDHLESRLRNQNLKRLLGNCCCRRRIFKLQV